MTSKEISEKLTELKELTQEARSTLSIINQLSEIELSSARRIYNWMLIGKENNLPEQTVNSTNEQIRRASDAVRRIGIGKFFVDLNDFITRFNNLSPFFKSSEANVIDSLVVELRRLFNFFEKKIGNIDNEAILDLILLCKEINSDLFLIQSLITPIAEKLGEEQSLPDNNEELSLFFTAHITYSELIVKLIALEKLYAELCRLLEISNVEFPLQISKFEVGSWWIKIFGESKVLALMTSLVESGVSFLHRTYTKEGKIQSIPKNVEVIEKLLDLSEKLKEKGIDTKLLEENIKHSSVVISNQLNDLLLGEPNVEVNNKKFYIGEELDQKLLDERKTLQLTNGESSDAIESESNE